MNNNNSNNNNNCRIYSSLYTFSGLANFSDIRNCPRNCIPHTPKIS